MPVTRSATSPSLPPTARLPINRCNLPAALLGSLTFQQHPSALAIDGVLELHNRLFVELRRQHDQTARSAIYQAYMRASFCLDDPAAAGYSDHPHKTRRKLDYLRLLRGWLFNSDSREGAVFKAWVESRFGLLARNHGGALDGSDELAAERYLIQRSQGLYNTNAIEAQLDLLYSYCQFELQYREPERRHYRLYRGFNRPDNHAWLDRGKGILLLNNLNSFTDDPERADEFGDVMIATEVPVAKLVYLPSLLPDMLKGEREYLVLGGLYRVEQLRGKASGSAHCAQAPDRNI